MKQSGWTDKDQASFISLWDWTGRRLGAPLSHLQLPSREWKGVCLGSPHDSPSSDMDATSLLSVLHVLHVSEPRCVRPPTVHYLSRKARMAVLKACAVCILPSNIERC